MAARRRGLMQRTLRHEPLEDRRLLAVATWDGGGDDNLWSTAENWEGDAIPGLVDDLVFPASVPRPTNVNDFATGTEFGSILIAGNNYNISGSAVALSAGVRSSGSNNTFGLDIQLTDNGLVGNSANGTFSVGGAIDLNGHDLSITTASGTTRIQDTISGAGDLVAGGNGHIVFAASNSYTGSTSITGGTLVVQDAGGLGTADGTATTGTSLSNDAKLRLENSITVANEHLSITSGGTLESVGENEWDGDIVFGDSTWSNNYLRAYSGSSLRLGGDITSVGYGYLRATGGGSILFDGTATLSTSASSQFIVSSVTLAGSGSISNSYSSADYRIRLGSNATLRPGPADGTGILTLGESVRFVGSNNKVEIDLNGTTVGTQYDQINLIGDIDITNATLNLKIGDGFAPDGDVFTIVNNDASEPIVGEFSGLSEGALLITSGQVFRISYTGGTGNDVTLTHVGAAVAWDGGGGDNHWSTAANWSGDTLPSPGDHLLFEAGADQSTNVNDLAPGTEFGSILIAGNNYKISGSSVKLAGGVTSSGSNNTFGLDIQLTDDGSIGNSGSGTFSVLGAIDLNGNDLSITTASGTTRIQDTISGAGDLVTGGSGHTVFASSNAYTGSTSITGGTLVVQDAGGLGTADGAATTGTTLSNNAKLRLENSITVANEHLTVTTGGSLESSGENAWNGDIDFGDSTWYNFYLLASGGSSLRLGGDITSDGYGRVYATGGGSILFDGTTTLKASDSIQFYVFSATLAGSGSIYNSNSSADYRIRLGSNTALSPGPVDGTGILTLGESVRFVGSNNKVEIDLNGTTVGTQYDQINLSGDIDLNNATLNLKIGDGFAPDGDVFTIVNNDASEPIVGEFSGLSEGALLITRGQIFRISYTGGTGNDVTLTHVGAAVAWDGGGGDNHWSTAANWSGDTLPSPGDHLLFEAGADQSTNVNDLAPGTEFGSILIAGNNYKISGSSVKLAGGVTSSGSNNTFGLDIQLTDNGSIGNSGSGTFSVQGAIDLNGNDLSITTVSGTTRIQDAISGAGDLVTGGNGQTVFAASNPYTGSTSIAGGTLVVQDAGGLGTADGATATGTSLSNDAKLRLENSITVADEHLTITTGGWVESIGDNSWNGDIDFGDSTSSNNYLRAYGGSSLGLGGDISSVGYGRLYATGGGSIFFDGTTTLRTLDSSQFIVSSATLAGSGSINNSNSSADYRISLGSNATLGPGPADGTGILTLGESVRFVGSNNKVEIDLNGSTVGTQYDQISLSGDIDLNDATLNVDLSYAAIIGSTFTIIDNDQSEPIVGTFSGLPEGGLINVSGQSLQISYVGGTGNDVVLTAVTGLPVESVTSAAIIDDNLVISDVSAAGKADHLQVSFDGTHYTIQDISSPTPQPIGYININGATGNGTDTIVVPAAAFSGKILVNGQGGDDTLTLDYSTGNFAHRVDFDGGAGSDSLALSGGSFADADYHFVDEHSGSIDLSGNPTISYLGLEPIASTINATNVTLNYSSVDETIVVTDAGAGSTTVDSTAGEVVTFLNPSGSLTINAGDGADLINVDGLASDYAADLIIDGQSGDDTVKINGSISLANKQLALTSDTIITRASIQTGGGSITLDATNDITITAPLLSDGGVQTLKADSDGDGSGTLTLAMTLAQFVDPNPATGNQFGATVVPLTSGNVVVTSPYDDAGGNDAGAVYLFDGQTGELLSTLLGAADNSRVGSAGVTVLSNGNYVVRSPYWGSGVAANAGAVTWGDASNGVSGVISASNSLVGSTNEDQVGFGGVVALSNGNYVVRSRFWDNGLATDVGAVTWGEGSTGVSGVVSASNSLVGSKTNDRVGNYSVTPLSNGNYVVNSYEWDNGAATNAGAVTWGEGSTGVRGEISASNSLVGSKTYDQVGFGGVVELSNGNYVVHSTRWDNGAAIDAGAVTWGDGNSGITGAVSASNSLVGSKAYDQVGYDGVTSLGNGNYVVSSSSWGNGTATNAGAVTWGDGSTGITGAVSASNSLVGSKVNDYVGLAGVTRLSNDNYVVNSSSWGNGTATKAGAVTWGDGSTGITGVVSASNSLVGSKANDRVGYGDVTSLGNGNYVVRSYLWDNGAATDAGAVTWGDGSSGVRGVVNASNSLVGSKANDSVGNAGVTVLNNGNFVVSSAFWANGAASRAGAVTWGDGSTGVSGAVSDSNSLVGSKAQDRVGIRGVTALSNGNYVVSSSYWDNGTTPDAGAVTWGDGNTGIRGVVSDINSLVGSTTNDQVGYGGALSLSNGNYVVRSRFWDNGLATDAGAVTWGDGSTGVRGDVSVGNSLVGSAANDYVGMYGVSLSNGNYVVSSSYWDNGTTPDAGAVTWGDGNTGIRGVVSASNSLVGSKAFDRIGDSYLTTLANDNFVVFSPSWDNGAAIDAGAVTWGSGSVGITGLISDTNSVIGSTSGGVNSASVVADGNSDGLFVRLPNDGGGRVVVGSQDSGFQSISGSLDSGVGTISLHAAEVDLQAEITSTAGVSIASTQSGRPISLGTNASNSLGLTDAELDLISTPRLIVGDASSGDVTINGAIDLTGNAQLLEIHSGGTITDTNTAGADLIVETLRLFGNLQPGASVGIFSADGDMVLADNNSFTVDLDGSDAGDGSGFHDQIDATGSVDIGTGVALNVAGLTGYIPSGDQRYTIIQRTGGAGTFDGLPEGATISSDFLGSGRPASITYQGGDGDDVELLFLNTTPVAQPDAVSTTEDTPLLIDLFADNGNGVDSDAEDNLDRTLTVALTAPARGTLDNHADGTITFDPNGEFDDLDLGDSVDVTFTYQIEDSEGLTDSAMVTVTIQGVNDNPLAAVDVAATLTGTPVTIDALANDTDVDADDDPSNFSLTGVSIASTTGLASSPAAAGSVSIVANRVVFDPGTAFDELSAGQLATVVIDYTMRDQNGATSSSTVTVTVFQPVTVTVPDLDAGVIVSGTTELTIDFSRDVDPTAAAAPFTLVSVGQDGLLGSGDDVEVTITSTTYDGDSVTLAFAALTESVYRLAVADTLTDPAGYPIDGDGDGAAGGSFRIDFVVDVESAGGADIEIDMANHGSGQLIEGPDDAFDGLNRLQIDGVDFQPTASGTLTDSGATVVTGSQGLSGLTVSREVTLLAEGSEDFVRTIEVLQNATGADITTTVRVVGNLGSDAATNVFATSSGDAIADATDRWIGTDDADGTGSPAIIHYIYGPGELAPTAVQVIDDNVYWSFDVTVPAGETLRLATLTILGDTRADATAAAAALVAPAGFGGTAAAYLTQDELDSVANFQFQADVEFSVATASDSEADGGNLPKLLIDGIVSTPQSIDLTITGGSATLGADFTLPTSVTIPAGTYDGTLATAVAIALAITDDNLVELSEDVQLRLTTPSSGLRIEDADGDDTIQSTHVYSITDDDSATFTVENVSIEEGGTALFTVSLDNPIDTAVVVDIDFSGGTASAADYDNAAQSVTFAAGSTTGQTFSVTTTEDNLVELTETFIASLSTATTLGSRDVTATDTATGTITDDDSATFTVENVTIEEGGTALFTVSLDNPIDTAVVVDIDFSGGTAIAADYNNAAQSVTFAAGSTTGQTFSVATTEDNLVELTETFIASLSTATTVGSRDVTVTDTATGTITDDDSATFTVENVTIEEGGTALFTVLLDNPIDTAVVVDIDFSGGTASGSDYDNAAQTVTFAAGSTTGQTFSVATTEDNLVELTETFIASLSTATTLGARDVAVTDTATGTITDDDSATFTLENVSIAEGGTAFFTVSLDNPIDTDVSLAVNFTDGTATGGNVDYDSTAKTVTFVAGTVESQSFTVASVQDAIDEIDEDFQVNFASVGLIGSRQVSLGTAMGTILDNDTAGIVVHPTTGLTVTEDGGSSAVTVVLESQPTDVVTVQWTTTDSSEALVSANGTPFAATTTLTFTPANWDQPQTLTIQGQDDGVGDGTVTFAIESSVVSNDPNYDAMPLDSLQITSTDDEPAVSFQQVLDEQVWLDVSRVSPDGVVIFAWGTEPGSTYFPEYGVTLGIVDPTLGSLAEGGLDGTTSGLIPIPFTMEGQDYLFQAFELAPNPQVSNVLPLSLAGVPVVTTPNNAAPELSDDLPSFTATVDKPFAFDVPSDSFVDPDSDQTLVYNARLTDGAPLPDWLSFDATTQSFHSDSIPESGQWSIRVTATDRGAPVRYSSTKFILRSVADRSVWQNASDPQDVNGDGEITPIDALVVINQLNHRGDASLSDQISDGESMIDVNGDRRVTPVDALQVINRLNQSSPLADSSVPPTGEFGDREFSNESPALYDDAVDGFLAVGKTSKVASFDSPNSVDVQSPDSHSDLQEQDAKSKDDYESAVDLVFGDAF
ncbi:Calx-beta domain-containing protein [Rosistilla oblonga]|nr:Calx-beta domain-containing protein [Rosistilla oblonga]